MNQFFTGKRVLVTGGAGFIGSHLVRELVLLGSQVTVLDDLSRGSLEKIADVIDKISFYKVDLKNEKKAKKYFKNQEFVFNLAALNTGVDFDLGRTEVMFEENMLLQMIPIRLAASAGVRRFIQISSASVYSRHAMEHIIPTPETADTADPEPSKLGYALAKQIGEKLAHWYYKNQGMETISVRFINVYGEQDNFDEMGHFIPVMVRKFIQANDTVEVFGSGNQKRSFMYVLDAVSALLLLAQKGNPGEVYNVDSNDEKSVAEVVNNIARYFKKKKLKIFFDISKPEGSQRRMLDSTKIRKLGWKPKNTFHKSLQKTIESIVQMKKKN